MPTFKTLSRVIGYVEVTVEAATEDEAREKFKAPTDDDLEYDLSDLEVEQVEPDWAGCIDREDA